MKKRDTLTALAALFLLALPAAAPANTHLTTTSADTARTEGEVRRVDVEAKKITIRHGAITNLDMPPMTMVFQVQDPGVLDRVKAGDKVRFKVDRIDGAYVVTALEVTR